MKISKDITVKDFTENYWLKEELVEFCRSQKLPLTGSKLELKNRIEQYLLGNKIVEDKVANISRKAANTNELVLNGIISANYANDELHREFFTKHIGKRFKFNVVFMNWIKENKSRKTYADAIDMWNKIDLEKKSGKKLQIGQQFEYNQYTRDFFKDNPQLTRADCITCWKYKKSKSGKHIYEPTDLIILKK